MSNAQKLNRELRTMFDGTGGFMTGHQIMKIRGRKRICPEWAKHDSQVKDLLRLVFPKVKVDEKQRARAGRWARVIQLYYRRNLTCSAVAEEMGLSFHVVDNIIKHARRAAQGKRTDGRGLYKKRGSR